MTSSGPKSLITRVGRPTMRYVVFLSSADEMSEQRDLFEGMVREANEQFRVWGDPARPFELVVERWENQVPQRARERINQIFVDQALDSHAMVVLMSKKIRPGTSEEVEAVVAVPEIQMSVIWMQQHDAVYANRKIRKFWNDNGDERIFFHRTGPPGSDESIFAMFRVIAALVASITSRDRRAEVFNESRESG